MSSFVISDDTNKNTIFQTVIYCKRKMNCFSCSKCKNEYFCLDQFSANEIRCPYCKEDNKKEDKTINVLFSKIKKLEKEIKKIKND